MLEVLLAPAYGSPVRRRPASHGRQRLACATGSAALQLGKVRWLCDGQGLQDNRIDELSRDCVAISRLFG